MVPEVFKFFSALLVLSLFSCAGQVPPAGGPADTIPPRIISTTPDTNSVRVSVKSITLEFSEYVNRRSVEESIFISPYVGELEFDWDGRTVTATFADSLKSNRTYVVNVGTDVTDMRANNRMASAFTLAFSTGDSIDHGVISGRVFDEKPEGVMIFAYRLAGLRADTLDPTHSRPDYITQSGSHGLFTLSHLAIGPYRIFAVRDEYHDLIYERQIDQYGVTHGDVILAPFLSQASDLWFRLSREDTTRPFLSGARPRDRYRIAVRFSEPVDSASCFRASAEVIDTVKGTSLPVALFYQDRLQPAAGALLLAAPLDSPATYRVRVTGIADRAGNLIDPSSPGELIEGVLAPDTVRPRISVRDLRDSIRSIPLAPPIELVFSDPVSRQSLLSAIRLVDTLRAEIQSRVVPTGAASVALIPRQPLLSRAWYTLRVTMDSVRSLRGLGYRDSTYLIRFQTMDVRATGEISGSVVDETGTGRRGRIFVTASSVDLNPPKSATLVLPGPGTFTFSMLPEGKYGLSGFRDDDSSNGYSYGLPFPFVPSERFVVFPDTLRVRARWSVEGALLRIR